MEGWIKLKKTSVDELRQLILEGTIDEFNEKGFKFTMDDIAKRLRISKKTIYVAFQDKETLFFEMVDYCFQAIKESERKIYEDSKLTVVQKIEKILIVLPDRYQSLDFRLIYEMEEKYPRIFQKIKQRIESDWETTISLFEEAMNQGKMKRLPMPIIKAIVEASIERFISSRVLIENDISYEEALSTMVEIIMSGLLI